MSLMRIRRLDTLPEQLEPNNLYITKSSSSLDHVDLTFVGDEVSSVFRTVSMRDIDTVLSNVMHLEQGRTVLLAPGFDMNNLRESGMYRGHLLGNAPDDGWWSFISLSHDLASVQDGWRQQIAISYGDSNQPEYPRGTMMIRTQVPETNGWSTWDIVVTAGNTEKTVRRLIGPGVWSTAPSFASMEAREMNLAGSQVLADYAAPRYRLHWLGRAIAELGINADGMVNLWAGDDRSQPNGYANYASFALRHLYAYGGTFSDFTAPRINFTDTNTQAGWWTIGDLQLAPTFSVKIKILGTESYSDDDAQIVAGETEIYMRGTNDVQGIGWAGVFNGTSAGQNTIQGVAVERISTNTFRIYVKTGLFASLSASVETTGVGFTPAYTYIGPTRPVNSRVMKSYWTMNINGAPALTVGESTLTAHRMVSIPGDNYLEAGPNSTDSATLRLGGQRLSPMTIYKLAHIYTTNGNIHIQSAINDADGKDHAVYLNWYGGAGGVVFGDGMNSSGDIAGARAIVRPNGDWVGRAVLPLVDNSYSVGSTFTRYNTIHLSSNPIVTSDIRKKTDIAASLGVDFINGLNPVSYRITDAKAEITKVEDGFDEIQQQVFEEIEESVREIQIKDGKPVQVSVPVIRKVPVFDDVPVTDESGHPVMQEDGSPLTHPVPRMETVRVKKYKEEVTYKEGVRRHQGFIADEVLELMESLGISTKDFAGMIVDEETGLKGLRYEQFIAPLVAAFQEQSKIVASQKETIDTLKTDLEFALRRIEALEYR